MNNTERIKAKTRELGFDLVGIAPASPPPDFDFFLWWLDQGYAGTMEYLRRGAERRGDPEKILPGVRSVICCGMNYYAGRGRSIDLKDPERVWISSYAWGEDYHRIVGEKLKGLEDFIQREIDPLARTQSYVDTGPLLERSYAARAGIGWIGKNTCLLNNGLGSYIFLGEILTTLELEYDRPVPDQCGSCTRCLESCPTGALAEPYVLDAKKCISYLTIEYRGEFSSEEEGALGRHVYGCDICQEVCPYNERIPVTTEIGFLPQEGLVGPRLEEMEGVTRADFEGIREKSPMERIRWDQWRRNLKGVG